MDQQRSRRAFLRAGAATGLLALAACSSRKPPSAAPGPNGSVTITHAFGETTIPGPPKRVVSAGFTGQDDLLALGVVPVAVTNWFGDQPFGVWPWATAKLGNAKPVVLNLDNGIQVQQIAALKPDLIVATDAGLDQDTYQKLTAIAPTLRAVRRRRVLRAVEGPGDRHRAGRVPVRSDEVVDQRCRQGFRRGRRQASAVQEQAGAVAARARSTHDNVVATTGWRTEFLTQMGLAVPDSVTAMAVDQQRALIPHDKIKSVLDGADVLVWTTESDKDQADAAGQSRRGGAAVAQRVHHQGSGRGDRLRLAAELPAGG